MIKFDHIMIDIETLGVSSNAVIQSIAAVNFDINTGEIGDYTFIPIDIQSCLDKGLIVDGSTIKFWLNQPREAIDSVFKVEKEYQLISALHFLNLFLGKHNKDRLKIWANSPQFDLSILKNAYKVCDMEFNWNRRNERDVRTIVSMYPEIKNEISFSGIQHNPIDDCRYQIELLTDVYNKIKL